MSTMDVKKLAGGGMALGLVMMIIKTAAPGTLAMIEVGLIGLLYVIRRQRQPDMSALVRKQIFEARAHGVLAHAPFRASISSR